MPPMSEEDLHALYMWVDEIPLSRPKRNIARDFADGVCIAEVVKRFFPKLVELHNYTAASSITQKVDNWRTLNNRVFRRLHFEVPEEEIRDITAAVPGAIERFLRALQAKIVQIQQKQEEAARSVGDPLKDLSKHEAARISSAQTRNPYASPGKDIRLLLQEKDQTISELQQTVSILNEKVENLEELIRMKDKKISQLQQRRQ